MEQNNNHIHAYTAMLKSSKALPPWCIVNAELTIVQASQNFEDIAICDLSQHSHILHAFFSSRLEQAIIQSFQQLDSSMKSTMDSTSNQPRDSMPAPTRLPLLIQKQTWTVEIQPFSFETQRFALITLSNNSSTSLDPDKRKQTEEQLMQSITHELRTPLTIIQGYTEYLLSQLSTSPFHTELETMLTQSKRINDMLTSIITLYYPLHAQSEKPKQSRPLIDELISTCIDNWLTKKQQKQIKFHAAADQARVMVDTTLFQIALNNLIDNALKFSKDDSIITVSTECTDTEVLIHVKDQGIGILPQLQSKIFTEFYKVARHPSKSKNLPDGSFSTSHSASSGFGLGLAITKRIVQSHGGEIRIASTPQKGSTFTIALKREKNTQ